ncbi:hypothetical protein HWV62_5467 [Athelia sp. TMB]|nr:hypothetical protein HWV62_5467 [Athelia sp. TMB]
MSTCPLTVHALLHIAESIKIMGPVWCYWAFPMERYCGSLQPAIRNRRRPYASLDHYALEVAQLTQIGNIYNISDVLTLKKPRGDVRGSYKEDFYPSCLLLPPRNKSRPANNIINKQIAPALATRYGIKVSVINQQIKCAEIEEWGKIRRVDSDAGDTISTYSMSGERDDARDSSFIRYQMYEDKQERYRNRPEQQELHTFYGRLDHLFVIRFDHTAREHIAFEDDEPLTIFLAAVRSCRITETHPSLDIHYYTKLGGIHVVDVTSIQSLVGRVRDIDRWAIIDRSGLLAQAIAVD